MQFPPRRPPAARGGMQPQAVPPRRPAPADLDPVPFPGGAEAALEFAAFEKGLLERGNSGGGARSREPLPIARRTPISEPNRDSVRWMLAGAGAAAVAAAFLLLLSSGLLATGFAVLLRAVASP